MKDESDGMGIAGFVLSILGLIFIVVFFTGGVFSILAIIFSNKQRKIKKTGLSTAGLVMGIIGTIINWSFWLILILFGLLITS